MHSPDDFRVSGLEVWDPLTSYLGSGLKVRIAVILYNFRPPAGSGLPGRLLDDHGLAKYLGLVITI